MIYNISQGNIAVRFKSAWARPLTMTLLQIYCLVCFERIFLNWSTSDELTE